MAEPEQKKWNSSQIFYIGLFIYAALNLLTASFMELHFDEAYYWLYAQNPALGYFDHPPMIAWMIEAGQTLFNNTLGLRLFTVVFSTLTILIIWQLAKKYSQNALLFWALIFSIILIHPYSFIATPDGPLFFFTALFFLCYDRFIRKDNLLNSILLGAVIACLFYSKYHGVLVVGFIVLTNLKLLTKRSFWIAALTAFVLFSPHIWWQFNHHFPTLQYHLIDSHKTDYSFDVTLNYIVSELAVTGPWLGWLFLYAMVQSKTNDKFELGLKVLGIGTFLFFLISTFGGDFEAHWTLIAFVPLILLSFKYLGNNPRWIKWVMISGGVNFMLLLVVRILLITPLGDPIKALGTIKGWREDSKELKTMLGDYPIVFQDGWNRAARFAYYTHDPMVTNLNSGLYRRNQFDMYDTDEKLTGKTVYIVSSDSTQFESCEVFKTKKAAWYVKKIDSFRSFYNLKISLFQPLEIGEERLICPVQIENTYAEDIVIPQSQFEIYRHEGRKWILLQTIVVDSILLKKGEMYQDRVQVEMSNILDSVDDVYLTFKIGELKPIPGRILIYGKHLK